MRYGEDMRKSGESNRTVLFLILIILVLVGIILYLVVLKPAFTGYVVNKQIEAQNILIQAIINQIQQQGFVAIPTNNNTSIVLVPYQEQRAG